MPSEPRLNGEGMAIDSCEFCEPYFPDDPAVIEAIGKHMPADEVRAAWPRWSGTCPKCGFYGVKYASTAHYALGDW